MIDELIITAFNNYLLPRTIIVVNPNYIKLYNLVMLTILHIGII